MSANNFAFKFEKERDFLLIINSENEQQKIQPKNEEKQKKKNFDENVCEICEKKLSSKNHLIRHMKKLHPNEISSAVYSCDHCDLKFLRKFYLIKHLKSKHQKGKEIKFECDFDGKIFERKVNLLSHMNKHQTEINKCKICEKKVKHLNEHMKNVHAEKDDKVNCQICNKLFRSQISLNYHLKIHNKKYQCQVCGHKFAHFTHLKEHLKVHEDKFAYRCDKCQKNFKHQSTLNFHLKTHDENRPKSHKCQHCDYKTDTKKSLTKHQRTHDKSREKKFKCPKCDYKTDQKGCFKQHLQIHEPNRVKFPCPACKYEATARSSLTKHIKRKHDSNKSKIV